jgi:hypothetical protein
MRHWPAASNLAGTFPLSPDDQTPAKAGQAEIKFIRRLPE